ncbi:alkanesulfonate monooxygenase SsuD/methylene tetrahydromethanopterin reductase-like flavin-dependent oxidoreductase (luciferase family) [Kineococcus radiotolerans]|uniref:Alkanesulfonate monooxygenase SsuD/methylene tetrahydromethanopterin reductase-like flavin-dependent oxidoreductase (Luciferase family) n=1 Tax=Kineococcus radiotolerans TaxID=131568 RepID=A0A7W4TKW8_KINRA|nr:LLM class flavin-dependent oxidoreductase [Kineococcus radiotolerans]MBB2900357.1 alkanesulfonate monooxygenase SsuD/methylene tetrahydromethanopterin reductase-like flavin-dependent oxidoreductase (luciferase family) [Kineococcus radiotolerans]
MVELSCVVLNDLHPTSFTATAREVEAAGLRTVFCYDHLSWRDFRDGPWFNAVPLLAAAAVATTRVRLGTLVASPNFRHPVTFAAEVMTLDQLSGGRVELGVGAGTSAEDAAVLGLAPLTPGQRQDRFEEWTTLLTTLLTQRVTDAAGERYRAVDARNVPGPVAGRVPLTVAAAGPRGLRFAARTGDTWVTYGSGQPRPEDSVEDAIARFLDPAARFDAVAGSAGVRRLALLGLDERGAFTDYPRFAAALAGAGYDEVCVHWPRADGRGAPAAVLGTVLAAHGLG